MKKEPLSFLAICCDVANNKMRVLFLLALFALESEAFQTGRPSPTTRRSQVTLRSTIERPIETTVEEAVTSGTTTPSGSRDRFQSCRSAPAIVALPRFASLLLHHDGRSHLLSLRRAQRRQ